MALERKYKSTELKHLQKECPYCQGSVLEVAVKCRHCGKIIYDTQYMSASFKNPHHATMKNCMNRLLCGIYQLFGLMLIVFGLAKLENMYWPLILFPPGIIFWMIGAMGVRWKKCSNCGCTIANKDISKCPRCYFEFSIS